MTGSHPAVVLLTGASRGIGRALAVRLAREGARLALVARSAAGLETTLAAVREAGGDGAAYPADVTDHDSVAEAVRAAEQALGPVDVLINNAGVPGPIGELWTVDEREWAETIDVNLMGTYVCCRALLPGMVQRRRGRIVNVVSAAGAHRWPYFTVYAVSKAAVIKMTESLAAETRPYGIAVLAAHPGLVRAGFTEAAMGPAPPAEPGSLEARIRGWFDRQLSEGHTYSAEEAAAFLADLAWGRADELSGRYVAIDDDLDALVERADAVRRENLHALKVQRLGDG